MTVDLTKPKPLIHWADDGIDDPPLVSGSAEWSSGYGLLA